MKKKVLIVGAGISGLSLAWYLQGQDVDITLVEASSRVGGWIQTKIINDFLFECGPRSFRGQLPLIEELGLQGELIQASAHTKYLAYQGRLERVPDGPLSFLTTQLGRKCLSAMLTYPFRRKQTEGDETVASYFEKRFGKDFVDTFIDPLCAGIYASEPSLLSMKACFPKRARSKGIFSFRSGMETLPKKMASLLDADIILDSQVVAFQEYRDGIEVMCGTNKKMFCDELFFTVPIPGVSPEVATNSVVTVSLGYSESHRNFSGFGFLASSKEEKYLLGVVFDSAVFPEQSGPYKTRLSVMMGGSKARELLLWDEAALKELAHSFVKKYLRFEKTPLMSEVTKCEDAIYAYSVGHLARVPPISSRKIQNLGAHLYGVSIPDCIKSAAAFAKNRQSS
ncbi:MAG: hemY [Chlamydiia bacterium]|nr:hemY [Chlamydiia bacterium]